MGTKRTDVYQAVDAELDYAEEKWGTEFDDRNTLNDWAAYAQVYIGRALEMRATKAEQLAGLKKAIGLLVNAYIRVEDGNIKPRHYDK